MKNIYFRSVIFFMMGMLMNACSYSENENDEKAIPITQVSLIPLPESVVYGTSNIILPNNMSVSQELPDLPAQLLKETLAEVMEIENTKSATNENAFIRISKDNALAEEGYKITVSAESIKIDYATSKGLLWGVQTLRQILLQNTVANNGDKTIPALTISDTPKKTWRGFHIDVARHMFTIDYLKKIANCLSFYKINKLQLHLTDDQGWRIEIKKYPELTAIGGWREFDKYDKRCIELSQSDPDYTIDSRFIKNNNEYGGYYTQEELKDFIKYATERGIDVIPEIDMPGHFSAAIKAFPDLSCTGETGWGEEFSYPVCAGKTEYYPFFKDIIDEVTALFPSEYMHIGADEVEKHNWEKCERCQKLIREENLSNVEALQNYFVKEMANYVKSKGKKVMAWDDAFDAKAPQDILYTYWRDWLSDQPGKITQRGYPIVFMEWGRFYLSATPSDALLKSLYEFSFEPQFEGIVKNNVIGFQACVWTETIPNERKFGQHVFPSLQAFSELAWGSRCEWNNFTSRLPWHLKWLAGNGIHSRTPGFVK